MNRCLALAVVPMFLLAFSGCSAPPKAVSVQIVAESPKPQAASGAAVKSPPQTPAVIVPPVKKTAQIPDRFVMTMAFAQQAPFGNWDPVHEETCEEASMIMADKYFSHQPLNEQIMEQELQKLLKWEQEQGYKPDLTAEQTVNVLAKYFGRTAHLSDNVTADQIKYEVSAGKPVIIPAAGRDLGNPNFKWPGPLYHMLIIKGYDNANFITNDPGTRKGDGYIYAADKLISAVHDWNQELAGSMTEADMLKGNKVMIVVDK